MTVGSSIFLIALGAILRYAVTDSISGIDLTAAGLILMITGAVGLVIGLYMMTVAGRREPGYRDPDYRDRPPV